MQPAWGHVTSQKKNIFTFTRFLVTKLYRLLSLGKRFWTEMPTFVPTSFLLLAVIKIYFWILKHVCDGSSWLWTKDLILLALFLSFQNCSLCNYSAIFSELLDQNSSFTLLPKHFCLQPFFCQRFHFFTACLVKHLHEALPWWALKGKSLKFRFPNSWKIHFQYSFWLQKHSLHMVCLQWQQFFSEL